MLSIKRNIIVNSIERDKNVRENRAFCVIERRPLLQMHRSISIANSSIYSLFLLYLVGNCFITINNWIYALIALQLFSLMTLIHFFHLWNEFDEQIDEFTMAHESVHIDHRKYRLFQVTWINENCAQLSFFMKFQSKKNKKSTR